jgi:hypothetical protein
MRFCLIFFACLILSLVSGAQISVSELQRVGAQKTVALDSNGWKKTGLVALTLNQSARSDWAAGGETFQVGINLVYNQAIHQRKGLYTLDGYFDMELGFVRAASYNEFRKTNDRLDVTLEIEHDLGKGHWNYGFLFNLNTQLFNGYNYNTPDKEKISGFLTPGKFLLAPGFDFKDYDKHHYFSLFLSPLTLRWVTKISGTFYRQDKFGVDSASKVVNEYGPYVSVHYNGRFSPKLNYIGRLDLFSNFRSHPERVDVLMNNLLTYNLEKRFTLSLILDILYDHDIRKAVQLQEIFGIGLRFGL